MLTKLVASILRYGSPVVGGMALWLIVAPWLPVSAQNNRNGRVDREYSDGDLPIQYLEKRLENIESLQIERRMTTLETLQKDAQDQVIWSKGSSFGTGLLLLKAALEAFGKSMKGKKEDDDD